MKLNLLNIEGGKSGTVEVSDKILNLKFNHKLVKYVIDWQLNHQKPRTAKTKQRNEVRGSTKKIYAQKVLLSRAREEGIVEASRRAGKPKANHGNSIQYMVRFVGHEEKNDEVHIALAELGRS